MLSPAGFLIELGCVARAVYFPSLSVLGSLDRPAAAAHGGFHAGDFFAFCFAALEEVHRDFFLWIGRRARERRAGFVFPDLGPDLSDRHPRRPGVDFEGLGFADAFEAREFARLLGDRRVHVRRQAFEQRFGHGRPTICTGTFSEQRAARDFGFDRGDDFAFRRGAFVYDHRHRRLFARGAREGRFRVVRRGFHGVQEHGRHAGHFEFDGLQEAVPVAEAAFLRRGPPCRRRPAVPGSRGPSSTRTLVPLPVGCASSVATSLDAFDVDDTHHDGPGFVGGAAERRRRVAGFRLGRGAFKFGGFACRFRTSGHEPSPASLPIELGSVATAVYLPSGEFRRLSRAICVRFDRRFQRRDFRAPCPEPSWMCTVTGSVSLAVAFECRRGHLGPFFRALGDFDRRRLGEDFERFRSSLLPSSLPIALGSDAIAV